MRQYFSLYRAVFQRQGERGERIDERKNVQTTPTRTHCKHNRPLPSVIQIIRRPGTGSLPHHPTTPWQHREWSITTVRVRQGCLLSPTFFNLFLERIMSDALEEHDGKVSIGGRNITDLRFADDIDALAEEEQDLEARGRKSRQNLHKV